MIFIHNTENVLATAYEIGEFLTHLEKVSSSFGIDRKFFTFNIL